uniref:Uncharacterized protein n=1 Tax=Lepeophtheirus salmonis TaxID=72036 RepID=A0A0K2V9C7_LEPSM
MSLKILLISRRIARPSGGTGKVLKNAINVTRTVSGAIRTYSKKSGKLIHWLGRD